MASGNLIVIGAGNWGTVLAMELSHAWNVRLWTHTQVDADQINQNHENTQYLPGYKIPAEITVEAKFSSEIQPEDRILLVVPSRYMASVCQELKEYIFPGQLIINASKGVEKNSLRTMSSLIQSELPDCRLVALTGPTIAREIADGEPARAVLSCEDVQTLLHLRQETENLPHLSFEMSRDVEGAELCAALKGIIAISIGIADGLGFHTNIQGVLMTYGLQEFREIANFLEIPKKTVYGLSGMGDLITTCISPNSRNRRFGKLIGQGFSLEEALEQVGMVVEGVSMARTITELSRFNLNIPLFKCITHLIFDDVEDVRAELLDTIQSIH